MTWNYRNVRYPNGTYGLHEVYYEDDGSPRGMTSDPCGFTAGSPGEMLTSLNKARDDAYMLEVFDPPEEWGDGSGQPRLLGRGEMNYPVGYGVPIGLNDCKGNPVHIGDTLNFDETEWGGKLEPYVVRIEAGQVQLCGTPSDVPQWCEIVKPWDDESNRTEAR